jgi:hypothetical protein
MSSIAVDPDALEITCKHIRAALVIAGEVRSRNSALAHEAAAAGRHDVEGAIDSFMNAWSYGLQHLMQDGDTLASFLETAARQYKQTDDNIAQGAQLGQF